MLVSVALSGDQPAPTVERFWANVDRSGDCWNWTAWRDRNGYGSFRINAPRKCVKAHRFSYAIANGGIPSGEHLVCHKCDNPSCVNPSHLFLGSPLTNARDMIQKKRNKPHVGVNNPRAKFDVWDIICIRADRRSYETIAKDYNITAGRVSEIRSRKIWRSIPEFQT